MHFTLVVTALLSLVDLSFGWAQADNGVWVANNTYHTIRGDNVHEACTVMNTQQIHGGACAYWVDGNGKIFNGHCAVIMGQDATTIMCK
ncbi:Ff.00g041650.m01.CDS01 [Fusarium sp. VM40]|nr:Ff.00g041650.m01.CDS01 [Fusarium sp. VM40]